MRAGWEALHFDARAPSGVEVNLRAPNGLSRIHTASCKAGGRVRVGASTQARSVGSSRLKRQQAVGTGWRAVQSEGVDILFLWLCS